MKVDTHLHSDNSHDGKASQEEMIAAAKERGVGVIAFTEHFDADYPFLGVEREVRGLDLERYRENFERARAGARGIEVLFGVECGYSKEAEQIYCDTLPRYAFDVIVNSVHSFNGHDAYFDTYEGAREERVYGAYLDAVLASVKAAYDYDVIAHIGYVMRYAPFENKAFLPRYREKIEEILNEIIARGKTLELNTNVKKLPNPFLPEKEIFKLYYEMGGRRVSFGSDAHVGARVGEKYEIAKEFLESAGFREWTVYRQRKEDKIPM